MEQYKLTKKERIIIEKRIYIVVTKEKEQL